MIECQFTSSSILDQGLKVNRSFFIIFHPQFLSRDNYHFWLGSPSWFGPDKFLLKDQIFGDKNINGSQTPPGFRKKIFTYEWNPTIGA